MSGFFGKIILGKIIDDAIGDRNNQKIKNCLNCGMVMPDEFGVPDYCPGCQKKPEIQAKIEDDTRLNQKILGGVMVLLLGIVLGSYFYGIWGGIIDLFVGLCLACFTPLGIFIYALGALILSIFLLSFVLAIIWFIIKLFSN